MINKIVQLILTLAVLAVGIFYAIELIKTAPETERRPPVKHVPLVDVIEVQPQSYSVQLFSRGTVSPRTESTLIPQVSGRVTSISDHFRPGGFFEEGDELLQIDPIDYELALTSAKAELQKMRLALTEEKAQAKQAESDWKKLGMKGKPDALVMREPQLAEARAMLASANAKVKRAQIDLERTKIMAPYAGRIMEQHVDIGQYVSSGTTMAKIYATEYVEVRLPLTDRQLTYVDLPENYRGEAVTEKGPQVTLSTELGNKKHSWNGRIVRTEGAIDTQSRQLFVIAQVDDPYARSKEDRPPLKIGQFVRAEINGKILKQVYVLPRSVLSGTNGVLIAQQDQENKFKVQFRSLEIAWQDSENVVISSGLNEGDLVISTSMPYATDGAEIRIAPKLAEKKRIENELTKEREAQEKLEKEKLTQEKLSKEKQLKERQTKKEKLEKLIKEKLAKKKAREDLVKEKSAQKKSAPEKSTQEKSASKKSLEQKPSDDVIAMQKSNSIFRLDDQSHTVGQ